MNGQTGDYYLRNKLREKIDFKFNYLFFIFTILLCFSLLFILTSCSKNNSENNTSSSQIFYDTSIKGNLLDDNIISSIPSGPQVEVQFSPDNTSNSQLLFNNAAIWGPINIFTGSGWPQELTIRNDIGIGWVNGGDYLYALDISNGNLIGDAMLSYPYPGIDIGEMYAFIYDKDGIKVYDINDNFSFVKTISNQSHDLHISNFGNYLYVRDSKGQDYSPDYLIDKKTLEEVSLYDVNKLIMGQSKGQDLVYNGIYQLLYPDCMICPSSKLENNITTDAVYSLKESKIIGYLPISLDNKQTHWVGWDPQKKFFFSQWANNIMVYDMPNKQLILTLPGYSLSIVNAAENYTGLGGRVTVLNSFSLSRNGFYFLNVDYSATSGYVLGSSGIIKCNLVNSRIIGEFKYHTFFTKDGYIGSNRYDCTNKWIKKSLPEHGPYFTKDSIAWMHVSNGYEGHGDAIYQWDYSTGSFLNYTEFTGYDVEILSSEPLILAMRSFSEGLEGTWNLVCYDPGQLPFNLIPDIKIEYGPKEIYPEKTQVKFTCTVTNLQAEISAQNISYVWDFGDGMGGSGREVTHIYKNSGDYNVSVSVRVGDSLDSSTESIQVKVAKIPSIDLTAIAQNYTAQGLSYGIKYKINNLPKDWEILLDFGDGVNEVMELPQEFKSHVYKFGNYIAKVTIYNADKTLSYQKEIAIDSRFPDFSINASTVEGFSVLKVNFAANILSTNLTDSGLKYEWKIGSKIISEKKAFEYVFVDPDTYTVILRVKSPTGITADFEIIDIKVNPPVLTFSDWGMKIQSSSSMFVKPEYDKDKDGINQVWEDLAMDAANPYFELDEEENWLEEQDTNNHKVVNFVRITPYPRISFDPSISIPKYILFYYCVTWSKDYGRYLDWELPFKNLFEAHNGDVEKVVMAWKVIDDKNLELQYVYTSAHGGAETKHSAVWKAKGSTKNKGTVYLGFDEWMCAALEFQDNRLKLQASEDKHAIYPTEHCGDNVTLVAGKVGEDCGGGGLQSFTCYNTGEPNAPLMDDIGFIFPNERIWSGNKDDPSAFAGGLEVTENCPGKIGNNLKGTEMLEDVLNGFTKLQDCDIACYYEIYGFY